MLQQVMDALRARGSPGAHLGLSARNPRAYGFYRRLGFGELTRAADAADSTIFDNAAICAASV